MPDDRREITLADATVAVEAVTAFRAQAVKAVSEALRRRLAVAPGPDLIHAHIDYLAGSLVVGSPAAFGEYLARLRHFEAERIPADALALSVDLLGDFFRGHLRSEHASPVDMVLQGARTALDPANHPPMPYTRLPETGQPHPATEELARCLVAGDQRRAREIVRTAAREAGYLSMAVALVQPALYRVGEWWQACEIGVAQEHLAAALAQSLLARHFIAAPAARPLDRRAVFACVAGNNHSVGLRIVADAFELGGWEVAYLGADTPTEDLLDFIMQTRPQLVGLSVSMVRQLPALKASTDRIGAELPDNAPRLIAGGLAMARTAWLTRQLGLDAWHLDARMAIEAAR